MGNPTATNAVLWAMYLLAGTLLAAAFLLFSLAVGVRAYRVRQKRLALDARYEIRMKARHGRAFEDACWYLLREHEANVARMVVTAVEAARDARAALRVLEDVRRAPLVSVPDLAELA